MLVVEDSLMTLKSQARIHQLEQKGEKKKITQFTNHWPFPKTTMCMWRCGERMKDVRLFTANYFFFLLFDCCW